MEQGLRDKVRDLRRYVRLAGKATPIEQLALDLADRNAHLEFTLELEDAWDESEHTFFADFLVVKVEQLQKTILGLEEDLVTRLDKLQKKIRELEGDDAQILDK